MCTLNITFNDTLMERIRPAFPSQQAIMAYAATYIDCTASTLLSECNSNGMNAKASYLGKFLNITGYVDDIDGSGEFICISDRYDLRGIRCNLDGSFRNILKDLKRGERITVKCKCTDVDNVYAYVVTVVEIK